jgi:hypothetical protein
MRYRNHALTRFVLLAALAVCADTYGQTPFYWVPDDADYNDFDGSVWDLGIPPDTNFDEVATISNGGVARVTTTLVTSPAQVVLGELAGESGALSIESGGTMSVLVTPGNVTNGGINVGLGGTGVLNVLPGGTLSAGHITLGGEGGSSVTLGGATAGTTTVTVQNGGNDAGEFGVTVGAGNNFRVIGPNVNMTTLSFEIADGGMFTAGIRSGTHSAIKSQNAPTVRGTLQLEFSNGVVPTVGSSWKLFDAPSITGNFDTIEAVGAPALPFGQIFTFGAEEDPTSQFGYVGSVSVEQRLVLRVNRDSGQLSIQNGPQAVSIDGYSVASGLGALVASKWNSLDDQNVSDWRESPTSGLSTRISELKPTGSTAVTAGPGFNLGNVFQSPTPTAFGTEVEDLAFEYYTPAGEVVQGTVLYEGEKKYNNIVLYVDPDTGAAQLVNQSPFAVDIDGYRIASTSGSLLGGASNWTSLDDQNIEAGAWREANPTANNLIELRAEGTTLLESGVTYDLGDLFKTESGGGTKDLVLQYLFPEDNTFTRIGAVVYRDVTNGSLIGDYNDDGSVNAADYSVWRDTLNTSVTPGSGADGDGDGTISVSDYGVWKVHYGSSLFAAPATLAQVPEPSAMAAAGCVVAIGSLVTAHRRRESRSVVA